MGNQPCDFLRRSTPSRARRSRRESGSWDSEIDYTEDGKMNLRSMLLERNGPPPEVSVSEVESRVQRNVDFIQRFLLPVDDEFFYYIVDELLVGEPVAVCNEVKSRLFQ